MKIIQALLMTVLVAACLYFSYTDLKFNKIKNGMIFVFGLIGLILDAVLYGFFRRDALIFYLATLVMLAILSVVMYAVHIWAAGDSKFMMLLGLLIPPSCSERSVMLINEIMIPIYAFGIGFLYLVVDTSIHILKKQYSFTIEEAERRGRLALKQFVINAVYVVAILKIEDFVMRKWGLQLGIFQLIFNVCLLILLGKIPLFYDKEVFGFVLGTSLLYSFGTGVWMLEPIRLVYYAVSFIYVILQILISEFNYQEIWTKDVKGGMILSTGTSMAFLKSRVKGLPGISFEDMRSRISEEEALAIQKWGKSKYGKERITIVRKVPFALFLSVGCMVYLVWRGVR